MANVKKKPKGRKGTAIRRLTTSRQQAISKPKVTKKPAAALEVREPGKAGDIARQAWLLLWQHKRFFAGYLAIFAVLNMLLVHNFGADIQTVKNQVKDLVGSNTAAGSVATYALYLTGSTSTPAGAAGVYQYVLLVVESLGIIWALRQFMSDQPVARLRIRDAFYESMYPAIQFVLVLVLLSVELLPFVISGGIYGLVLQSNVAVGSVEHLVWLAVFIVGIGISVWLLAGSLLAMYIVTLPRMTPIAALKNARQLIRNRHLWFIRKILFLVVLLLIASAVILIPILMIAPLIAGLILFLMTVLLLPYVHSYFYMCYRELLP